MKSPIKVLLTTAFIAILVTITSCNQNIMQINTAPPPENAIVLFDGSDFSQWESKKGGPIKWKLVEGDAMQVVPWSRGIMTKQKFQNFKFHVEFKIPTEPVFDEKGRSTKANSGIYLQRRYEVQILDSYGDKPKYDGCGALYRTIPPDKNVCKKPGQWQSFDIAFYAPKFKGEGENLKKVKNARITVVHNDVTIHNNVEIPNKTGKGLPEGPEPGPILLQDHKAPVQFRNIWIVPL